MRPKLLLSLIYIILLNSILIIQVNSIIIPLKRVSNPDTSINYIESLLHNQLYAEINLGTPEQLIYLSITTETETFSIESKTINDKFYSHIASSSHIDSNKKLPFYHERYKTGYIYKETFYFNSYEENKKETYKNISFDYILELSEDYTKDEKKFYIDNNQNEISGVIGLQILKSYSTSSSFINSLSNIGAINRSIWSLIHNPNNDNNLYLIIGENPYKTYENTYNDIVKQASAYLEGSNSFWYFLFSDIKVGDEILNEERSADYAPQMGVIIGTNEYKEYINEKFFSDLIKESKCNKKNVSISKKTYSYYECNNDINVNNFEPIIFTHQEFSYNFTLDKNDLFVDYNNKKYFICVFLEDDSGSTYYSVKRWVLGLPFVKKYNFLFDHNSKKILFYQINQGQYYGKGKISVFVWIIIVILGMIAALAVIYLLYKIIVRPKKIQANELEDSFNYNSQKNQNETDLSSFYHSKYNKLGI